MRQSYVRGEKLCVDYAGDTVPVIVDRLSGETRAGTDLRRGDGRIELHLRQGRLDCWRLLEEARSCSCLNEPSRARSHIEPPSRNG